MCLIVFQYSIKTCENIFLKYWTSKMCKTQHLSLSKYFWLQLYIVLLVLSRHVAVSPSTFGMIDQLVVDWLTGLTASSQARSFCIRVWLGSACSLYWAVDQRPEARGWRTSRACSLAASVPAETLREDGPGTSSTSGWRAVTQCRTTRPLMCSSLWVYFLSPVRVWLMSFWRYFIPFPVDQFYTRQEGWGSPFGNNVFPLFMFCRHCCKTVVRLLSCFLLLNSLTPFHFSLLVFYCYLSRNTRPYGNKSFTFLFLVLSQLWIHVADSARSPCFCRVPAMLL